MRWGDTRTLDRWQKLGTVFVLWIIVRDEKANLWVVSYLTRVLVERLKAVIQGLNVYNTIVSLYQTIKKGGPTGHVHNNNSSGYVFAERSKIKRI